MYTQAVRIHLFVFFFGCLLIMVSQSRPLTGSNTAKNFLLEGRSHWAPSVPDAGPLRRRQTPAGEAKPANLKNKRPK
jgi:hypothetical protein